MLQTNQKIALSTCVMLGTTYLYLFLRGPDSDADADADADSDADAGYRSFFSMQTAEKEMIRLAASVKWSNPEMLGIYDTILFPKHLNQYSDRPETYSYLYQFRDNYLFPSEKKRGCGCGSGSGSGSGIEEFNIANIGGEIEKALTKPFRPLIEFVERVTEAFDKIPDRVRNFDRAFKLVGDGIEKEFENIGKSLNLGVNDVFDLVGAAGQCGIKFMTNLRSCSMWYIMDGLGAIIYAIFVELPLFVIKQLFDVDLHYYVTTLRDALRDMDDEIFKLTSYHVIHFPEDVIRDCYECDISAQVKKLKTDFNSVIPDLMNEPNAIFGEARDKFRSVFT
jgi:hypothetical protein